MYVHNVHGKSSDTKIEFGSWAYWYDVVVVDKVYIYVRLLTSNKKSRKPMVATPDKSLSYFLNTSVNFLK